MTNTYLVSGAAGFIGAALCGRLLREGHTVVGFDNLNDYYDPTLKQQRVDNLVKQYDDSFTFHKLDLTDGAGLTQLVADTQPQVFYHLAAQASVRYALKNPSAYLQSNLIGHFNVLEAVRLAQEAGQDNIHLVYASTSSVYGGNDKVPFEETDDVSRPQSLYAATKRADELLTYSYCNMFGLKATAVRFFTVYGPWGRPDMSPMIFGNKILMGEAIPLFNGGDLWRDFTYVDDIVEGVVRLGAHMPTDKVAHAIFNIGNNQPVKMTEFVTLMEEVLGKKAVIDDLPWPPTEVYKTYADTSALEAAIGWKPSTPLRTGLERFATWFVPYYESAPRG